MLGVGYDEKRKPSIYTVCNLSVATFLPVVMITLFPVLSSTILFFKRLFFPPNRL